MGPNLEAELRTAALAAGLLDVDLLPLIKHNGTIAGIPAAIAAFKAAKPNYFGVRNLSAPDYRARRQSVQRDLRHAEGVPSAEQLRALAADGTKMRSLDRDTYQARRAQASRILRRAKI